MNLRTNIKRTRLTALTLAPLAISALSLAGWASAAPAQGAQGVAVSPSSWRPAQPGPAANFTGSVRVQPLFAAKAPGRTSAGSVTFEPGARSAWHTHPLGQALIVTRGTGWVQSWGDPVQTMRTGDVVQIPAGVKHWHGATATTSVTHVAVQEESGGKNVAWLEKVTDAQYDQEDKGGEAMKKTTGRIAITQPHVERRRLSPAQISEAAPVLEEHTQKRLYGEVWKRPGLSARDRSLITVAALIARNQTGALTYYIGQALENGVKPREVSEEITHLAYYSGWGNAMGAAGAARDVFAERGIGPDQLPSVSVDLLPIDEAAEAKRAETVARQFGDVAPGVVQYTTDLLFRDLWLRPDLAPRDRSLVTVAALVAAGQSAQITFHLDKAMDNGLTKAEASEVFTHLAFYVGWPNVMSALPVAKGVFEKRAN
ncbi:cupin domain-containing protein [bacterium]|nr:MAG: cupin domain-containing protein [bacterium]